MISLTSVTNLNLCAVTNLYAGEIGDIYVESNSDIIINSIKRPKHLKAIVLDDSIIGLVYIITSGCKKAQKGKCWIEHFMIDHKYQGKGYGRKSFEKIIEYIKTEINPKTIKLSTANETAAKLYLSFGFVYKYECDNEHSEKLYVFYF